VVVEIEAVVVPIEVDNMFNASLEAAVWLEVAVALGEIDEL
jgi:hypothetical protein